MAESLIVRSCNFSNSESYSVRGGPSAAVAGTQPSTPRIAAFSEMLILKTTVIAWDAGWRFHLGQWLHERVRQHLPQWVHS